MSRCASTPCVAPAAGLNMPNGLLATVDQTFPQDKPIIPMNVFDFLIGPGILFGCIVGMGFAALLHWLFPEHDLLVVQALLVVAGGVFGVFMESKFSEDDAPRQ